MKWLRCLFYRFSEQLYGSQIANSHSTVYSLTNIVFAWPVEWKEALQWNQMKCSAASMTFRITCNGRPDPARTPLMMTSIVMRLGGFDAHRPRSSRCCPFNKSSGQLSWTATRDGRLATLWAVHLLYNQLQEVEPGGRVYATLRIVQWTLIRCTTPRQMLLG